MSTDNSRLICAALKLVYVIVTQNRKPSLGMATIMDIKFNSCDGMTQLGLSHCHTKSRMACHRLLEKTFYEVIRDNF